MLDPSLAAQLLIVALDSAPWPEYNCQAVLDHMAAGTQRTPFRYPRSDSGGKHKRRRVHQDGSFSQPSPSAASSSWLFSGARRWRLRLTHLIGLGLTFVFIWFYASPLHPSRYAIPLPLLGQRILIDLRLSVARCAAAAQIC